MTYVGATPTTGDFKKLDSITTSSATTFNLRQNSVAVYPQSANHCIVSLNGVIQAPVDAFTIVNDTIVFASSLASSDVINFILVLGNVNDIGTVSDDTVSTAKLQANSVTAAKLNTALLTGHTDIGANIADADLFLIDDGAGGTLRKTAASRLKTYAAPSLTPDNLQYFIMGSNATMSSGAATTITGWGSTELTADLLYNCGTQYVSHSSGVFSFSTEGYYHVAFRPSGSTAGSSDGSAYINITTNDSAYSDAVDANFSKSTGAGFNIYMDGIFKITDTSNHKLTTSIYAATNNVEVAGNTTRQRTYIRFQRLGTAA